MLRKIKHRLAAMTRASFPRLALLLELPSKAEVRYGWGKPPHREIEALLEQGRAEYHHRLESFLEFATPLLKIPRTASPESGQPMWENAMFPALDAIALYGMLCLHHPKRYIEVGAGHSTRFARRAIADHHLPTLITCIDPAPGIAIDALADRNIRARLEDVPIDLFRQLEPGDFLFMDNSHRVLMNSDATVVFLDIIPMLKPGVLVHFHDIHLPFDYPPDWHDRFYSEQYLLAAYLLGGSRLKVLLPNAFITRDKPLHQILDPLWNSPQLSGIPTYGGSFWTAVC